MSKLNLKEWIAKVSGSLAMSSATCTVASGWTNYYTAGVPKVYKKGGVCTFIWTARPSSDTNIGGDSGGKVICTIPEGYRPPDQVSSLQQCSSSSFYMLQIRANGEVFVQRLREVTSSAGTWMNAGPSNGYTWFPITITYVAA